LLEHPVMARTRANAEAMGASLREFIREIPQEGRRRTWGVFRRENGIWREKKEQGRKPSPVESDIA
jgi:hypothetical protein